MIDIGGKTLLETFVKYQKIGWRQFLMPKSAKMGLFCLKRVGTHFEHFVWGWLEDTIGIIKKIIIEIGGKNLSGNFVIYKKSGCQSFLMPKSAFFLFKVDRVHFKHTLSVNISGMIDQSNFLFHSK